jgi:hypothetical protein
MQKNVAGAEPGGPTFVAIGHAVGTRPRRWLFGLTLLAGLLTAVSVAMGLRPAERTFTALSEPVHSLMSVAVPLLGILLVRDLWRARGRARLIPTLLATTLLAAAIGVFGVLVCAAVVAIKGSGTADTMWSDAGIIAVGSILVQVVAGLVGTGLALLLRSVVVAFLASIVLPLGLWYLLGAVDILEPAQAWLTPYATVRNLLSGEMSAQNWVQWLVVLLIWGVGLNAVGAARLNRST